MDDISLINQNTSETVEHLSYRIHKIETVISEYLEQYHPNDVVTNLVQLTKRIKSENSLQHLEKIN